MIKLLFYIHKINLRDGSIGEYLSFWIVPVFFSFIERHDFSPFVILLLISNYCNQFKNILEPFFIKITGMHNSTLLLISNLLIFIYSTFFFSMAQIFIYFYFDELYDNKYLLIFTTINLLSIIIGNFISIVKRFNDSKLIGIFLNICFFVIFSAIYFLLIYLSNYKVIIVIAVCIWIVQLITIQSYDNS